MSTIEVTTGIPAGEIERVVGQIRAVGLAAVADEDMKALKAAFRAWARGYDGKTDLSIEQEYAAIALFQRLGDERAANVVVKAFDRAIVARTKGHEDAAQEERLALFKAMGRFDLARGLRLYTYAARDMQTRGQEAKADECKAVSGANGATGGLVEREAKRLNVDFDTDFARAAEVVAGHNGFTPFEVACAAIKHRDRKADAKTVRAAARLALGDEHDEGRAYPSVMSLSAPVGEDGDLTVGDGIAADVPSVEEQAARNEVNGRIARLVATLPADERLVIECRFMRGLTLADTALEFAKAFPGRARNEIPSVETIRKMEIFTRNALKADIVRAGLVEAEEPKTVAPAVVEVAPVVEMVEVPVEAVVAEPVVERTAVEEIPMPVAAAVGFAAAPAAAVDHTHGIPVQLGLFGDLPIHESPKLKAKAERERRKVVPLPLPLFDGLPEVPIQQAAPEPLAERRDNVVAFRPRRKDTGPLPLFAWAANHAPDGPAEPTVDGPLVLKALFAATPPPDIDSRPLRAAAMAMVRRATGQHERIRLVA